MALQKPPPPPPIASSDPVLNRWLLAITAFIKNNGTIDPGNIDGWNALVAAVTALQGQVATLGVTVAALNVTVTALQAQVTSLAADVVTLQGQVAALQARSQVFNGTGAPSVGLGVDGDWYANRTGAAGSRIYIKAGGTWTAFPF